MKHRRFSFLLCLAFIALSPSPALRAGPPFQTDDPEPVDFRHWEAYFFSTLFETPSGTNTESPAWEFNVGAAPNLQLHLIVPFAYSLPSAGRSAYGFGDIEAGFKYRFVQETKHRPQIGIFPLFELPSGDASRGLGNGQTWVKLPLWLQKSSGPWTTYGGGGYAINHAPGQRSYGFGGWLLQRDLSKRLTLGMEIFSQGADTTLARGATFSDFGGYYNFTPHFSLLFSAGHSVLGEARTEAYLGLYWTW